MIEQTDPEDELRTYLESIVQKGLFSSLTLSSAGQVQELWDRFRLPLFSVRDAGITAKRFHGWHRAGLLPFGIPEGKMNLLTFPEFIWVRMIDKLRQMGTPLQRIKLLKDYLYSQVDLGSLYTPENIERSQVREHLQEVMEQMQLAGHLLDDLMVGLESGKFTQVLSGHRMPTLELMLFSQLMDPQEAGVVILPGSQFSLWAEAEGEPRPVQTHLYLSVSEEVREFRMNPHLERKTKQLELPSLQEKQVLQALRDRGNRSVTVTFTDRGGDRQMDLVTTRREELDEGTKREIVELLKLKGYNEVMLKTSKGELVFSERSNRKRL